MTRDEIASKYAEAWLISYQPVDKERYLDLNLLKGWLEDGMTEKEKNVIAECAGRSMLADEKILFDNMDDLTGAVMDLTADYIADMETRGEK